MLQYTIHYHVVDGKEREFVDWLERNDDALADYSSPGWKYSGTRKSVLFPSTHDRESRFEPALSSSASPRSRRRAAGSIAPRLSRLGAL
jgi:hypothetical protein